MQLGFSHGQEGFGALQIGARACLLPEHLLLTAPAQLVLLELGLLDLELGAAAGEIRLGSFEVVLGDQRVYLGQQIPCLTFWPASTAR